MLSSALELLRSLTDPERLIHLLTTALNGWLSYAFLFTVVFAETGLLVGFFLPGDSLLFTIGVVTGAGQLDISLILTLLVTASILGDQCGYFLGYRTGPRIFSRPNSRLFKQEYIQRTHAFYERHGGKTLIYAKFVPIIRTFAPFIAGVGRMRYRRFLSFNVFGGLGWVMLMVLGGHNLGGIPFIRRNFDKVVLLIVLISVAPMLIQILRSRVKTRPSVV